VGFEEFKADRKVEESEVQKSKEEGKDKDVNTENTETRPRRTREKTKEPARRRRYKIGHGEMKNAGWKPALQNKKPRSKIPTLSGPKSGRQM
jgi:hypothetical protein